MGLEDLAVTVGSQDHSWSSSSSSSWIHLQLMLFRHSQLTIFVSSETIHILITLTNRQGRGRTKSTFSKFIYVWMEFKPMKLTGCWWGSLTDKYQRCHLPQDCTGPVSHTVKPILGQYGSRKQVNLGKDSIWRPSIHV